MRLIFAAAIPHGLCNSGMPLTMRGPDERERGSVLLQDGSWLTAPVRLQSAKSGHLGSVHVTMRNDTAVSVTAWWIDFDGNEKEYQTLLPGDKCRQHTFVNHAWIFREAGTRRRMSVEDHGGQVFFGGAKLVRIVEPPPLPWQVSTHVAFPEDFKRAVRALLLCHSHLEARGGRGLNYAPFNEASASATAPSPRSHGIQLSTRLLHRVMGPSDNWLGWAGRRAPAAPSMNIAYSVSEAGVCMSDALVSGAFAATPAPEPPNLGALPKDLVVEIVRMAAPLVGQDAQRPDLAPDVPPFQLARDPTSLVRTMFGDVAAARGVVIAACCAPVGK